MQYFVGIDFGTTNSGVVAILADDKGRVLKRFHSGDSAGHPLRSVVAVHKKTGETITGTEAWEQELALNQEYHVFTSVKSELLSDRFKCKIKNKKWDAVCVATELLRRLATDAKERKLPTKQVTMAIPVGFDSEKRQALRLAAENAGIEIVSFISEPTAAFFANYQSLKGFSNVAVFDWGGGTLDISILHHERGKVYEKAAGGMPEAGDYIDNLLAERVHSKIVRQSGQQIALTEMPQEAQDKLWVKVEQAKMTLSDAETATVSINKYGDLGPCRATIDYDWFGEIVRSEVEKALDSLAQTLQEAGESAKSIDKILVVGGSSKLRPLKERLREIYGEDKLLMPEESEWSVAEGAAILAKEPGEYYANQMVGLKLSDESTFELLPQGAALKGWHAKYTFGLVDTDEEARFVFTGSADIDKSTKRYKTLAVPAYSFLEEKLTVEALVDRNMIFQVKVSSQMRPESFGRVWQYANLKCYYQVGEE